MPAETNKNRGNGTNWRSMIHEESMLLLLLVLLHLVNGAATFITITSVKFGFYGTVDRICQCDVEKGGHTRTVPHNLLHGLLLLSMISLEAFRQLKLTGKRQETYPLAGTLH